jgi:hypothetical protein
VTFHGIKVIWTVVGVGVVGRFDMEGGEGCFVLFCFGLVWFGVETPERAVGLRIRLIIRLIIKKYIIFIINMQNIRL